MPPSGYFVDTNLLVLYVVGQEDPEIIAKHGRLEDYSIDDYILLNALIAKVGQLFVTPNTLTETCNLLGQHADPERTRLFQRLRNIIEMSSEITVTSTSAANSETFLKLGLTDAVLCEAVSPEMPVLTVDFSLYLELLGRAGEDRVINFTPLRNL
ncbi:MAG: hypothetical protein OXE17_08165 [Chloroflexi bacterium]|nr:hypothetical protein [Chloroflexota bacterium]